MAPTAKENEASQAQLRRQSDRAMLDSTLKEFGNILDDEMAPINAPMGAEPLMRACQILGAKLDIDFQFPSLSTTTQPLAERLHAIAQASHVNYRDITLPKNWWLEDHGPLLGYFKDNPLKPVVLSPDPNGGYSLIDPEAPAPQKIHTALAQKLDPTANIFYRLLPAQDKLSHRDMLHFCLHGRKNDLWFIFMLSLLVGVLSLFLPFANEILFDHIIPSMDKQLFMQLLLGLALIFLSIAACNAIKEYAMLKVETYLNHDVEAALWQRLLDLPMRFFRRFTVGDLFQRLSCVTEIRRSLAGHAARTIINAIFATVYLVAMFYYSPTLSAIALGLMLFSLAATAYGFAAIKKRAMNYQFGIINGKVIQMIIGLSKIRTHGAEERIFRFWAADAMANQRLHLQMGTIANRLHAVDIILDGLKYFVIFFVVIGWVGATSSPSTMLSLGAYLAFNIALVNFAVALADLNATLLQMPNTYALWHYAKVILDEPLENSAAKITPPPLSGAIHIEHVSFRYDDKGALIHDDISIRAAPGEFVAIVGPSGCGKSSLIRLLLGFESPQQGAIHYDGQDLATLYLPAVRRQISTILQNSQLMDGTMRENITGGKPYALEEIMAAVEMAGFKNDLQQFPMGLNTVLTSAGTTISSGQRQRLFLAGAFLSKAKIMLWDEATGGLDNRTQQIVMQNMQKLKATRIIVAHRLSAVKHADRIYVLDRGKVAQCGTFAELAQQGGLFADMLARQSI